MQGFSESELSLMQPLHPASHQMFTSVTDEGRCIAPMNARERYGLYGALRFCVNSQICRWLQTLKMKQVAGDLTGHPAVSVRLTAALHLRSMVAAPMLPSSIYI